MYFPDDEELLEPFSARVLIPVVLAAVPNENAAHRLDLLNEIAAFHFRPTLAQPRDGRQESGRSSNRREDREGAL